MTFNSKKYLIFLKVVFFTFSLVTGCSKHDYSIEDKLSSLQSLFDQAYVKSESDGSKYYNEIITICEDIFERLPKNTDCAYYASMSYLGLAGIIPMKFLERIALSDDKNSCSGENCMMEKLKEFIPIDQNELSKLVEKDDGKGDYKYIEENTIIKEFEDNPVYIPLPFAREGDKGLEKSKKLNYIFKAINLLAPFMPTKFKKQNPDNKHMHYSESSPSNLENSKLSYPWLIAHLGNIINLMSILSFGGDSGASFMPVSITNLKNRLNAFKNQYNLEKYIKKADSDAAKENPALMNMLKTLVLQDILKNIKDLIDKFMDSSIISFLKTNLNSLMVAVNSLISDESGSPLKDLEQMIKDIESKLNEMTAIIIGEKSSTVEEVKDNVPDMLGGEVMNDVISEVLDNMDLNSLGENAKNINGFDQLSSETQEAAQNTELICGMLKDYNHDKLENICNNTE